MNVLVLLRQHEPELKKRFGVAKIGIFGSFARGEERPDSDVDILVTFQKGKKTFDNFMGTKFYLEDLFKRKVDLVTDAALKPLIRDPILQDVVYAEVPDCYTSMIFRRLPGISSYMSGTCHLGSSKTIGCGSMRLFAISRSSAKLSRT